MALIKSLVDSLTDESIKVDLDKLLDWKKSEVSEFTKGNTRFHFMHQLNEDMSVGRTFEARLTPLQQKLAAFHKAFWYSHCCSPLIHIDYTLDTMPTIMYTLSATAVVALETSFNTDHYASEFRKIFLNLHSQIMQSTLIGKNIIAHLRMLHQEGRTIASRMKRLVATTEQTELIYVPSAEELHLHESNTPGPSNWPEQFQPELNNNFLPVSFPLPAHDAHWQLQLEELEELSAYGCFICS
ncbi:hypothetical protein EV363DRAFT_1392206 [Boletus edulis]|nr:hypothetical protein EV363DRAFT_1392206 [Boletus edulis]